MSFYSYVLYSPSSGRYYKGHFQNLEIRLKKHNARKTQSINAFIPWHLVYHEVFATRERPFNGKNTLKLLPAEGSLKR
ncbi:MAG: GIY-YIG nuclease family protein [Bacteroidales bacterium]|nr:GIY-YIG nuclease family protein [Bacteroidales bacterium]